MQTYKYECTCNVYFNRKVSITFAKMQEPAHEIYMQRCLQLAKLAAGCVAPNPIVGAVLVCNGKIIGEGYHKEYGGPHAEVHCINEALQNYPDKIPFSTMYVSLEPCAHFGKTPPCADLIIKHQIPKVFIGCKDSFIEVDGKGVERLRKAGVEVHLNVLEKKCIALNKAFFTFHQQMRPYVLLKWAQTSDGYIAGNNNERLRISNEYTNRLVHQWRSEYAAIMIGANTAIKDNPLLDNRNWFGPAPKIIIFDPHLKVPTHLQLFQKKDIIIVLNTIKDAVAKNIIYIKIDRHRLLEDSLQQMHKLNIQSLLVEGGRKLLHSFIVAGLWDEAYVITNKKMLCGEGISSPLLFNHKILKDETLLNDEIKYYKNIMNHYIDADTGLF